MSRVESAQLLPHVLRDFEGWLLERGCFAGGGSPTQAQQTFAPLSWTNWDLQVQLVTTDIFRTSSRIPPAQFITEMHPTFWMCTSLSSSNSLCCTSKMLLVLVLVLMLVSLAGLSTSNGGLPGVVQESELKWRQVKRVPWLRRWINLKARSCCNWCAHLHQLNRSPCTLGYGATSPLM